MCGFIANPFACGYCVDGYGWSFDLPNPSHTHVEPNMCTHSLCPHGPVLPNGICICFLLWHLCPLHAFQFFRLHICRPTWPLSCGNCVYPLHFIIQPHICCSLLLVHHIYPRCPYVHKEKKPCLLILLKHTGTPPSFPGTRITFASSEKAQYMTNTSQVKAGGIQMQPWPSWCTMK